MNKRLLRLLSVLLILGLCISGMYIPIKAANKAALNKSSAALEVGQTLKLSLSGSSGTVKWTSDDTDIAKVSSKGIVTAKDSGYAIITATDKGNGMTYDCMVTVYEKTITIEYGTAYKLKAKKGIRSTDYEITDEFDYTSFSVEVGSATTIKPTKAPKYRVSEAELWIDYSNNTSCLYHIIVLNSASTDVDTTTPIPTQKLVTTPTPKPTATPTPTPSTTKLDISAITDGINLTTGEKGQYWFMKPTETKVTFNEANYSLKQYQNPSINVFTINYSVSCDYLIESATPYYKQIEYWFKYTVYDKDDYIVETGTFHLPSMYIGGKAKGSFEATISGKYGTDFRIVISADNAY